MLVDSIIAERVVQSPACPDSRGARCPCVRSSPRSDLSELMQKQISSMVDAFHPVLPCALIGVIGDVFERTPGNLTTMTNERKRKQLHVDNVDLLFV